MYRLTRDDGIELLLSASAWEAALELACLYGWKPAGTESPEAKSGSRTAAHARATVWDGQDYFSYESQRVGEPDARSLAGSVLRALAHIPDRDLGPDTGANGSPLGSVPLPSRRSAVAEGMTGPRRKLLRRLAQFAHRGGFRIASSGH